MSLDCGYLADERAFVSLFVVEAEHAEPGTRMEVLWDESPDSTKPQVEPHQQRTLRAAVAPAPFVQFARGAVAPAAPTPDREEGREAAVDGRAATSWSGRRGVVVLRRMTYAERPRRAATTRHRAVGRRRAAA
ncbi:hypothetical protein SAMN06264364_10782 [Quadrisphaera granulorum]|uniref:Uncharacterized protein n=1 Tax=Quadrisphaera granulorum TaxID=317664 RepID=A0A316A8Y8_9ACTN|nr:hypothetical protein [Quadrisphaera granulorum]PWJ54386.1 hypothetical protein BXY45_10782 [Quadrisphaera granulorum]SZE96158.1 hypothetical protein SAMN06264364_10782 [Quadrisphaera granulorum]